MVAGGPQPQGRSPKERVPQGQSQKGTFLLRLDHVKANKARVTKAVSVKDAGYDDPEDGNNKEAITSSKAGDGIARAAIVKASLGKFGHCVTFKAAVKVKDKVTDGSKQMNGNDRDTITTKAMTQAQHW